MKSKIILALVSAILAGWALVRPDPSVAQPAALAQQGADAGSIQELMARAAASEQVQEGPWIVTVRYWSKGKSLPGFPQAVTVRVDEGSERELSLAQDRRKAEQVFDVSAEMKKGSKIHLKIDTYRLQFENLGLDVVSTAEVVVRQGGRMVFSRKYSPQKGEWLRTLEALDP